MANALNKVNSGGIEDGSIVNADIKSDAAIAGSKLADNAVGLAQMASGTDGQIITYDASGDPIAVGPGTDGQVLTSTGAGSPPAFENLPASGPTLSGSTNNTVVTVTGANAMQGEANLTFDGSTFSATGTSEFNVTSNEVDIKSTGSGDQRSLRLLNADASANNKIGIYFGPANNVAGAGIYGIAESDFTTTANRDGGLGIETREDGNWHERVRITSDGHVTTSRGKEAFWYKALSNTATDAATDNDEILVFSQAITTNNDCYNTTNGRYTAPVAGIYYFYFNCLIDNDADDGSKYANLYKNGSNLNTICYTNYNDSHWGNNYMGMSGSCVVSLAATDYVQIWCKSGIHTAGETSFGGFLVG